MRASAISRHLGPGAPAASGDRLAGAAGAASHQQRAQRGRDAQPDDGQPDGARQPDRQRHPRGARLLGEFVGHSREVLDLTRDAAGLDSGDITLARLRDETHHFHVRAFYWGLFENPVSVRVWRVLGVTRDSLHRTRSHRSHSHTSQSQSHLTRGRGSIRTPQSTPPCGPRGVWALAEAGARERCPRCARTGHSAHRHNQESYSSHAHFSREAHFEVRLRGF